MVEAEFAKEDVSEVGSWVERWDGNVPYPLQLSHLKGKRSSWRQKDIWQWAPIASTSPVDIALKEDSDWSFGLGVLLPEAILGGVWVLL